jgi:3-phosphoshikimate 1-carboxyvinyltransferase
VEHEDGVTVRGPARLRAATLDPEGDHRMVMAFAILGALQKGIAIEDADCVAKSFPGFFDALATLRASPTERTHGQQQLR